MLPALSQPDSRMLTRTREGKTFDQVRAEVEARASLAFPDQTLTPSDLRVTDDGLVEVAKVGLLALTEWSRTQLSRMLGIARWDRWFAHALVSGRERAEELNRRLSRLTSRFIVRARRYAPGETAGAATGGLRGDGLLRALLSATYTPIDDTMLFEKLGLVLGSRQDEMRFTRVVSTDRSSHYVATSAEVLDVGLAGVKDLLHPGVILRNSEVGFSDAMATTPPVPIVVLPPPTISPSQVTTYLMCPRKFAFTYVEQVPKPWKPSALAFGSCIHSAIEAWQDSRLSGDEISYDDVVKTFLVDWEAEKAGDVKFKDGEDEKELVEKGKALLKLFMEAMKDEAPQAVELPFTVDLVDPETGEVLPIRLKGVFDLLLPGDRVVEVKTAARAWDEDTLQRNLQLTAYHYAYKEMIGRSPSLEVVTLLKQKSPRLDRLPTVRTNKDHSWFVHLVEQVNRGIENNVFPPNPGWPCAECEYASQCRGWRG